MKTSLNKKRIAAIALLFLFTISAVAVLPTTTAHDPIWNIPTYAFITVSPNPVGVNQQMFVIMWLDKVLPLAAVDNNIRFHNYKLTITDPNGDTEVRTFDTIYDTTSSQYTLFTPTKIGIYTFKFEFPGETYTWTGDYTNDKFLPSSAETTLTVQADPVTSPPTYPLPNSFWTRPIEGQNTAWVSISSNYLAPRGAEWGAFATRLQPDGSAPSSAHVMWTKPIQDGGIVGGTTNTGIQGVAYYTGLSYEGRMTMPIIMQGRLYYPLPLSDAILGTFSGVSIGGGYVCVDLLTGEQVWKKDFAVNPSFGQIYDYESPNQHGAIPYLWAVSGSTWMAYEPSTGTWLFNLTGVPAGTNVYGPNGEILRYVLDTTNHKLSLWNNTAAAGLAGATSGADMFYWRPVGKSVDASNAYSWTVTIPDLPAGSTIYAAINDDLLFGGARESYGFSRFWGTPSTYSYWALSLKSTSRGTLKWVTTLSAPANNATRLLYGFDPETRTFFENDKEARQWLVYSLDTGEKLWGPSGSTRDFNYYGTIGMGAAGQAGFAAYGNLYTAGYGGELICYDLLTGNLEWKYNNTNSGDQTPWGLYPLFIGAIADGKVYCFSGEHSPNTPLYKGEKVRCIDAYNGEEIWTIDSWGGVGSFAGEGFPVADGYIAYLNNYDAQVYCIGKGPSQTTVSANPGVGNVVTLQGTVTDICAGAKEVVQSGEFNYVPAISDADMGNWMAYIYMQKPMPTDATGVSVNLFISDANGNVVETLQATTDVTGHYAVSWTPTSQGLYTVTAAFDGTNGYYPSTEVTSFSVGSSTVPSGSIQPTATPSTSSNPTGSGAPTASPSQPENPTGGVDATLYVAIAAVIVIAIIVAVAFLLRRKK